MNSDAETSIRRSLRKWRIAAISALVLLVASLAWSAYVTVDAGVTLTYQESSLRTLQDANALLEQILLRVSPSTTKPDLFRLLQELGVESFEKEGAIHAGVLSFYFGPNQRLACVTAAYVTGGTRCEQFMQDGL